MPIDSFTNKAINTIRFLAVDGVQTAKAGHPGAPMALAPVAYTLWTRFLRHNPADPAWPNRDRFILSNGHASMLLYSLLHLTGYDLPLAELKRFRQWKSLTAGHPEYGLTPGVETTTGPLGQGFTSGVGMAIAQAHLAALFNKPGHEIIDHFIYAIVSDGDLMEGISSEAASLAAHYKLGRLIYIYDDNHISIEGDTKLAFTEDRMARFEAYGWHTQSVADGNDLDAIEAAVKAAQAVTGKPSIIAVRTIIGYGSPNKQGSASSHGAPLGVEEVRLTKENLGWPVEPDFLIPDDVLAYFRSALTTGAERQAAWQAKYDAYAAEYPELAAELQRRLAGELPAGWDKDIPVYEPDAKGVATRNSSGAVLNAIAANMPELIGGSADLSPSNKTTLKGYGDFQAGAYENRNFHFGVREHAMAAILNGMAVYGGIRPYGGTFMVFADYMRGAMRMSALMKVPVIYVLTHDSIGVGEDGPTHQPVEHAASLRIIPNMTLLRPGDAKETAAAWRFAIQKQDGPVALALTRQNLPTLAETSADPAEGLAQGGYILIDWPADAENRVILIASGSEVQLAVAAVPELAAQGIAARVVSMPSMELFDAQPQAYRDAVLPPDVTARVSVEAGVTFGWAKYTGLQGANIGLDRFGSSGPYRVTLPEFGFTVENVIQTTLSLFNR